MTLSSPSAADNRIVIGKAGAPHGIRGELRVIPLTDFPERFEELKQVYVGDELLDVASVKYHKQFVIIKFKQYPSREDVAQLTGSLLYVDKKDAMPLEDGDVVVLGLEVFDMDGVSQGFVTDVLKTGANDVYVASKKGEAKQLMIPALKAVVKEINIKEGRMVVDMPEEI